MERARNPLYFISFDPYLISWTVRVRTVTTQFSNSKCLLSNFNISSDLFPSSTWFQMSTISVAIWSFQTTLSRPPSTRRPPTEPRLPLPSRRPPSLSSSSRAPPPPSFCIHGNARHNRAKGASYYVSGMRDNATVVVQRSSRYDLI